MLISRVLKNPWRLSGNVDFSSTPDVRNDSEVAPVSEAEVDQANESDKATWSPDEEELIGFVFGLVASRNRDRTMPAAFVWT